MNISSRGQIAQFRFYSELFVNTGSLMTKFSDFAVGNGFPFISCLIAYSEAFGFVNFTPLTDTSQSFAVDQAYVTFAIGAIGSPDTANTTSGTLGTS